MIQVSHAGGNVASGENNARQRLANADRPAAADAFARIFSATEVWHGLLERCEAHKTVWALYSGCGHSADGAG